VGGGDTFNYDATPPHNYMLYTRVENNDSFINHSHRLIQ
jgi:hypothetical protein